MDPLYFVQRFVDGLRADIRASLHALQEAWELYQGNEEQQSEATDIESPVDGQLCLPVSGQDVLDVQATAARQIAAMLAEGIIHLDLTAGKTLGPKSQGISTYEKEFLAILTTCLAEFVYKHHGLPHLKQGDLD
ncbi:hypothetical protein ACJX0J_042063, partial [Zea mays]